MYRSKALKPRHKYNLQGSLMMINVLEYLEQSAAEDADRIAVCDGHKEFTRAQLLELSRRVGSGLLKTVERRRPVIVFMEKTADTLTAFSASYMRVLFIR